MGIDPVTHTPRLDLLDMSSILRSALANPSFLNLQGLLGAQALMNPDLLKLAATATLLSLKNNTNLVSQNLQQINNNQVQLQSQVSQPDYTTCQFQSDNNNVNTLLSANMVSMISTSSSAENSNPSYLGEDLISKQYAELAHCLNNENQNMGYESVLSTPLSTPTLTPLNSSSTYVNSSTEEERDTYCSDIFKFEIPESLDINDFL